MSAIVLDTLEFAAKLKAGGFTEQQAEAQARAIAEVVEKQLATRQDMEAREAELKRDIAESENLLEVKIEALRVELKRDLKEVELKIELARAELKKEISDTKSELIRWVVAVGFLQSTLIIGILLKLAHLI